MERAENSPTSAAPVPAAIQMLNMTLGAMMAALAICAAAQLGIADLLKSGPRSSDELAVDSKTHPASLYRLLRALATLGVVAENSLSVFALTPLGETLRSDVPQSMRAMAIMACARWRMEPWMQFVPSLQSGEHAFRRVHGKHQYEYLVQHAEDADYFNAAMTSLSQMDVDSVLTVYDFSKVKTVVDVGAGQGAFMAGLMRANPSLQGIVYDRPPVVERTSQYLRKEGFSDRVKVIGGDFRQEVPSGGDLYCIKNVLLDWSDEDTVTLLKNCRRVMSSSSRLLIVEPIVPGPEEPHFSKLLDLEMLIIPGGRARTVPEYKKLLSEAGFTLTRVVPTPAPPSILEATPYL
jgi:O-methyltransferase